MLASRSVFPFERIPVIEGTDVSVGHLLCFCVPVRWQDGLDEGYELALHSADPKTCPLPSDSALP